MSAGVKIKWTPGMIQYIRLNFGKLNNQQLADDLGLKITSVRIKAYELGLRNYVQEDWTKAQTEYLIENFTLIGDVDIANYLNIHLPRKYGRFTKKSIRKKRGYLKLSRTTEQIKNIRHKNSSAGGNAYTIQRNSGSKNMSPGWIANCITWRNKELTKVIRENHPELIELKRKSILLKREIIRHGTK